MGKAKTDTTAGPEAGLATESGNKEVTTRRPATEIEFLKFDLLRSAIYHDICQRRLGRLHRALTWMTIMLGSSAIAGFGASFPMIGLISGLLVTTFGATSLVCGFGELAVKHAELRRRFYGMLAEAERSGATSELRARMTEAFADEPPMKKSVNEQAHNQAGESLFGDDFRRA